MPTAVIVDAIRTPLGRRNGKLKDVHPVDLAAHVLKGIVDRNDLDPALVEDVIMGCVMQVGEQGINIARNAALAAGFPESTVGTTVDRQCGSSQQAAHFAAQGVIAGAYDVVLAAEIVAVPLPPNYDKVATRDNGIRENQTMEALAKLKPYFDRKYGSVTPGNSSQITDGAAAVVVASESFVGKRNLKPLGRIAGWGFAGLEPERMGLGPSRSTPPALRKAGWTMKEIGLVEMNEAFAAQVLANLKAFETDAALGHPVGSSGTRLILTLLLEMRRRHLTRGLATLCIGGGQGASILLEAA